MIEEPPRVVVAQTCRAADRLERARAFLRATERAAPCLIVVPSRAVGIELVSRVLAPSEAAFRWRRHELSTLENELAASSLLHLGLTPIRGLSQMAVCARAVDELAREGALGRLSAVADRPGLVRALVGTLSELRAERVSAEQLADVDPDLSRVFARYEALLDALRVVDRAALLAHAERGVLAGPESALLWLDVPLTSASEARLFFALCRRAPRAFVGLAQGDRRTADAIDALELPIERFVPADPDRSALGRLSERLFRVEESSDHPLPQGDATRVDLFTSPGESREAVEIARRVQAAAERGVAYDRMAIALRAPESYRAQVEEALARAEIPAFFADGVKRPDPAGRALLSLIECAREGLSARAFAEYLSLGMVPRAADPGAPGETHDGVGVVGQQNESRAQDADGARAPEQEPDDATPRSPRRWERLLVDGQVIGGRVRWERRLASLQAALEREEATLEVDDPRRASLARDRGQLAELSRFALPVLEALASLPHERTWGEWIASLDALCVLAIRDCERVRATLAELWPLGRVGPVSVEDVLRLLSPRLSEVIKPSTGGFAGKLLVASVDELRGRELEVVFVPGLAEKVFPPRVLQDALLPDRSRRALNAGLLVVEDRVAQERLKLRVLVGAAKTALVLSYPRFDVEHGRPRVPSFYALEVLRALDGTAPSFDDLRRRAEPGAAARMGYPAPSDPNDAIDDAELDLAMLARLFEAPSEQKKGAARYLLEASPKLARSLRFRARRWSLRRFSHADGLVAEDDEVRALLAPHRLAKRPYSASSLSLFAHCPYAFFLHSIMGISAREGIEELDELDARQRGIVFHAVQRATLSRLSREQQLPVTASRLAGAIDLMRQELAQEAERVREETPPAIDRVLDDMLAVIEADLSEWLSRMTAEPEWVPARFELGFGLSRSAARDEHSLDAAVPIAAGVLLRGAIDLVEERVDQPGQPPVLRATDYKTGDSAGAASGIVRGGQMLQPVLYALVLEALFQGRRVEGGRLYFCTSRGGFVEHVVLLHDGARNVAREVVQVIDRAVERGFMPAAPKLDGCASCAYLAVCGPHEGERVAKKKLESLSPLHHLRNLP